MMTTITSTTQASPLAGHGLAATLAMVYAFVIAQSQYVQTGLQFVGPLAVIAMAHFGWLAIRRGLVPGYAGLVLLRSAKTSLFLVTVILLAAIFAPMPSQAGDGTLNNILGTLFCLFVLALVAGIFALALYLFLKFLRFAIVFLFGRDKDRLNDAAGLLLAAFMLLFASLEGVPGKYQFGGFGHATARHVVSAQPEDVWQTMQVTTSPHFPLPQALRLFPQPVEVLVDEGTDLGSNRIVKIAGREGSGELHLRVVERTDEQVVFEVLSDTSPMAAWIKFKTLRFRVFSDEGRTRLDVSLTFERLLAPAWIFDPMMKGAAYLAMDVLARDTKKRSEGVRATFSS